MLTSSLQTLAQTIQESCSPRSSAPPQSTAWPVQGLSTLPRAAIHEWFNSDRDVGRQPGSTPPWLPPLAPILHLARQAAASPPHLIAWIGRRVWPYPRICPDLLDRSIFIDAKDLPERAWAADVSLRSPALAAVIADGSAFTMAITRRLQLAAADSGSGGVGLILRPHHDLRMLSAAHTRWTVTPTPSPSAPRWILRLLRAKGAKLPDLTTWTLELNHETGALHLVPHAADRSLPPQEIRRPGGPTRVITA